ncbi:hypothetical protein [Bacillus thuringiensis]|uniref:hypothetical protein n=1 Tax=Bacillus thuringiensis TaxID=1428 RepID=UPI000BFC64F3|nr:hypothetical protein [Bacillus thuringiensis]PGT89998.1 hypothetical protein COD17_09620 [Bacillus thuringiensis]
MKTTQERIQVKMNRNRTDYYQKEDVLTAVKEFGNVYRLIGTDVHGRPFNCLCHKDYFDIVRG